MSKIKNIAKAWLPFAVVITAFSLLAYVSVQQSYRQGADDPQIQLAFDTAYELEHGGTFDGMTRSDTVEMSRSLAPFIVLYDMAGAPVAGSGLLDEKLPEIPKGVLDFAGQNGENRLTWEPQSGVRIASVIVPFKDGFVLAGRNMREVERREAQVSQFAGVTWILALVGTLVVIGFGELFLSSNK